MVDEQYIAAHVTAYPADRGTVLISNHSTGRPDLLSEQLFGILKQADQFDTLTGHTERLFSAGWEDDGSGFIQSAFQELIAHGLLIPKRAFQASLLEKTGARHAPPPVTSVIITTRDRIPLVQRCLASCIQNCERHDRRPEYLVLDDSRIRDQDGKMKETLAQLAARGPRIAYAGMEEKARFADELVRAAKGDGLPEEVVSFALFGDEAYDRTVGANRNALLLAVPGELAVMMDDDTLYQPAVLGESDAYLALSSMKDPTVSRFYGDRRQLLESVHATDVDILSCHEKLLGRSIPGCVSSLGPDSALDLARLNPQSAHSFGSASKVVTATASGFWGDSGVDSPHYVLELRGESREFLMRSREQYARAMTSREVFRSVSRYTISDGAVFIPMNAGVDNRTLLPPFLPVGRNSDGIFAMTLRVCADDALIGHIPFAVLHSPLESRRYSADAVSIAAPRLAELMPTIANGFTPSPWRRSMSERLSDLGAFFIEVGSQKTEDFREYIESAWVAAASRYIGYLEFLLDLYHGQPDYWAEDVLSFMEKLTDFTVHHSAAAPQELLEKQSPDQAVETCRGMVRKFGELLQWWPVIHAAATELRAAGTRLASPL